MDDNDGSDGSESCQQQPTVLPKERLNRLQCLFKQQPKRYTHGQNRLLPIQAYLQKYGYPKISKAIKGIKKYAQSNGEDATDILQRLEQVQQSDQTEIGQACVYVYTLSSFLYQAINQYLRDSEYAKINENHNFFNLLPYCCLLQSFILSKSQVTDRSVYRAIPWKQNIVQKYQSIIGKTAVFFGFTSTTKKKTIALKNFGDLLFVIKLKQINGLQIEKMSYYPIEKEVLLPAGVKLIVQKVKRYQKQEKRYRGYPIRAIIYFTTMSE